MFKKLQNYASANRLKWAMFMGITSSLLLVLVALLTSTENDRDYFKDVSPIIGLIRIIFYFTLLQIFFLIFTFYKNFGITLRILNTILFAIILFIIYFLSYENIEYLNEIINIIPIKSWSSNGYEPDEQELSSTYTWIVLIILSFINVFIFNSLNTKRSLVKYLLLMILIISILSIIILF